MLHHRHIQVSVNDLGRFTATVGTAEISTATFQEAKDQIEKELVAQASQEKEELSLPVLVVAIDNREVEKVLEALVVGINRTTRQLLLKGIPDHMRVNVRDGIIPNTSANREKLENILHARQALRRANEAVRYVTLGSIGSGRIEVADYARHTKQLREDYEKKKELI